MSVKVFKTWVIGVLVLSLLVGGAGTAAALSDFRGFADYTAAEGLTDPPEVASGAAVVLEVGTGTVLYAKNAFEEYTAASTQKILTALIAVETTDLHELVTFSASAMEQIEDGGHNYDVSVGEVMSMRSCLDIMMLASINEAANAVAEHISGSLESFAQVMNKRAEECGAQNSAFYTPSGLNAEGQHTTAFDMAMIAAACARNPTFVEIASQRSCSIRDAAKRSQGYDYRNHNKMMLSDTDYYRDYVVWGKTGYTYAAKNTLVTYSEKDGVKLVCVILRGKGAAATYQDTAALCDYYFARLSPVDLTEELTGCITAKLGECTSLDLDYTGVLLLPNCAKSQVTLTPEIRKEIDGTVVGRVVVNVGGTEFSRTFTARPKKTPEPSAYVRDPQTVPAANVDRLPEQEQLDGQVTGKEANPLAKWLRIGGVVLGCLAALLGVYVLLLRHVDKEIEKRRAAYENAGFRPGDRGRRE